MSDGTHFLTATRIGRAVLGFAGVVAFVAIWKFAQASGWAQKGTIPDPFLLPRALLDEWTAGRLLPAIRSSLIHYVWGLSLGTLCGLSIGIAAALSTWVDAFHSWLARILRPIPPLAWIVFAIAWFKVSHAGAAFVIAIGVFWINYFATYSAVRNVEPKYYELARAFGQDGFVAEMLSVTMPAASPGIFAGMRTGIGSAWMTLIAAELLGVSGMGQEMDAAAGVGSYETVVIYMLAISLVYTLSDTMFKWVEKRALQWRPS
ncbi:MAG TPA: ABC transporter permease [Paralcaligenes sp.]